VGGEGDGWLRACVAESGAHLVLVVIEVLLLRWWGGWWARGGGKEGEVSESHSKMGRVRRPREMHGLCLVLRHSTQTRRLPPPRCHKNAPFELR
jgi:hypothetical protein